MVLEINKIYEVFLNKYGKQYWWPVTKQGLTPKYNKKINLTEKQKLEICFGAILTQNTNWKNVEKAIINLNENNLIDIKKIIRIKKEKLANIIRSSGYHNQKSLSLKNFSNYILNNYNGKINKFFSNDIDDLRTKLLSIKGIGPETADSIILYAAKKPIFVIDAYTKRIFNRLGFKQNTYDEFQTLFMNKLTKDKKMFSEYHALIVHHGKYFCKTKPLCDKCILNSDCKYRLSIN